MQTALIVGSGPSATQVDLSLARGRCPVIATNHSWKLVPWCDVLFACDIAWWKLYGDETKDFEGLKAGSSPLAAKMFDLYLVFLPGNNSGTRSIHLAEKFGAKKVLLIGFDMNPDIAAHWHADHPKSLRNPGASQMMAWRTELEKFAPMFEARGLSVVNCSPLSTLKCFPYQPFEEAIYACDNRLGADRCPVAARQSVA